MIAIVLGALLMKPSVTIKDVRQVQAFSLKDVTILPGLQRQRMDVDIKYLKSIDPIRLLYGFYVNAGLKPKEARYGGWEAMGIEGHSLGHYLSACALMYSASGDTDFKGRAESIVKELDACQKAHGDGFLGGMPDAKRIFDELRAKNIRSQGFDLNGNWVPWYNIHKTLSGLLDTYHQTGNKLAVDVLTKNATWIEDLTKDYSEDDWQKMLACEHGGMNESLADLYSITHNPDHLKLADKFHHKVILDPLEHGERKLAGKHGNTQIPKIIGAARLYEVTAEPRFKAISTNFWHEVVEEHTYANGGHGLGEHFGTPKKLNERLGSTNAETCNSYNMLKLTDHMFQWSPSTELGDFYEKAQLNHILTSEDLKDGGVTYFVPLGPGMTKSYSSAFDDFTCCRGTGMENHAKYGEAVYYHKGNELWVNLYTPSKLNWKAEGVSLTQTTEYPAKEESTFLVETKSPKDLTLKFRCPAWATEGMSATINGVQSHAKAGEWLALSHKFTGKTTIEVKIPMAIHLEPMPDNPSRVAVMYGPTLLVANWNSDKPKEGEIERSPVFLASFQPPAKWLERSGPRSWKSKGNLLPGDLEFKPFYDVQHERYSAYLDVFTQEEWTAREAQYRKQEAETAELNTRSLDVFQPGEMQSERDHNVASNDSGPGEWMGKKLRHAWNGGWFSFDVKVDENFPSEVIFTYWGGDKRTFDVLVDGALWHTQVNDGQPGPKFFDVHQALPADLIKGKKKITIRIQAKDKGWAGGLFGVRVLKK